MKLIEPQPRDFHSNLTLRSQDFRRRKLPLITPPNIASQLNIYCPIHYCKRPKISCEHPHHQLNRCQASTIHLLYSRGLILLNKKMIINNFSANPNSPYQFLRTLQMPYPIKGTIKQNPIELEIRDILIHLEHLRRNNNHKSREG